MGYQKDTDDDIVITNSTNDEDDFGEGIPLQEGESKTSN
jgi:hypothetical protein